MKIMVSGSRTWNDEAMMLRAFVTHVPRELRGSVTLYHGDADGRDGKEGADKMADRLWRAYRIGPVVPIPANWDELGLSAGPVRNGVLVAHMPDKGLFFNLGTPGTTDALRQAKAAGIVTFEYPEADRAA
jgi:hypothetical protein